MSCVYKAGTSGCAKLACPLPVRSPARSVKGGRLVPPQHRKLKECAPFLCGQLVTTKTASALPGLLPPATSPSATEKVKAILMGCLCSPLLDSRPTDVLKEMLLLPTLIFKRQLTNERVQTRLSSQ